LGRSPAKPHTPPSGSAPPATAPLAITSHTAGARPLTETIPESWKVNAFRLTFLTAIAWLAMLLWLVLNTANPAVISAEQLEAADALVTAHRVSPSTIAVDQVWFGPVPKTDQNVVNFSDLGEQQVPIGARQFCIPLSLKNGRWWVTTLGHAKPRVYPATKSYLDLVRDYVRQHPQQRDSK